MKETIYSLCRFWFLTLSLVLNACFLFSQESPALWISAKLEDVDTLNIWTGYRKNFDLDRLPKTAFANIAVDSKYWLYLNGKLVVFEGGLKRGPNPQDTYYDVVDLRPYLKKGTNYLRILVWYFGKEGFSHKSSGKTGLYFDLASEGVHLKSDQSWTAKHLKEYTTADKPLPNFRLPESNICYDARIADHEWINANTDGIGFEPVVTWGIAGGAPWNQLIKRPIPLFKDFGIKEFTKQQIQYRGDTLVIKLPYNMQFTPYLELEAPAGKRIKFMTDNYLFYNGSAENIRAEYISKQGKQAYESLGWINGHFLYIIGAPEAKIVKVGYRESGYQTTFAGSFVSDDPFFNRLWEKAQRTLYITMRDTYMDCPDRERAQWTGDAVLESEEAFYALDTTSHALARKWLYEIANWQKADGTLYGPVPAGNWDKELPDQVLATIGYYGLWTYYMHTGDRQILRDLYPHIQKYLKLWEKYPDGLVKLRAGGWQWGDWGGNKDMLLLYNLWYYLALKGNCLIAKELGLFEKANELLGEMEQFSQQFNKRFWNGREYRDPDYNGKTDDRVHALAVLAGIASPDKYEAIKQVFNEQEHASPYMEKYVFEAMFKMGLPSEALQRHKRRFESMVNNQYFTTLFEGWGIGAESYGGGTVNHAWSGGGLTILSAYLSGIRPLLPGYSEVIINPQLGTINQLRTTVASVAGPIKLQIDRNNKQVMMKLMIPKGMQAKVVIPQVGLRSEDEQRILLNNKHCKIKSNDQQQSKEYGVYNKIDRSIWVGEGTWSIKALID
ncbi:alpha-L-rhamnosidase C-terminal domain-containing protein [Sphingobacterium siyangense]|uniref:alpha-L-rhamnosidase-related protein n=1 Tax=Sphingobacterium siyangense TaxID=459529 RepID=UPI003DA2BF01